MRILHISDIHWRPLSRHEEYTKAFEELFRIARDEIKPDIIINTGDTYHLKTQGITPEVIERLSWMIRSLANIAPTYTMLGNHDGNLKNLDRQDAISPIHEAVAHKDAHLLKYSGHYDINDKFCLSVYSPFDKNKWDNIKPIENKVNIALFHGAVSHARFDNNYVLEKGEKDVSFFDGYDVVLLGDIHQHQHLAFRPDMNGKLTPWVSYPGSLIQQGFGETTKKGFLVWDIESRQDWKVKFHELPNFEPFIMIDWMGSIESSIANVLSGQQNAESIRNGRIRINHKDVIEESTKKLIVNELISKFQVQNVSFRIKKDNKIQDEITLNESVVSRKSFRNDAEVVFSLYKDYVKNNSKIIINDSQIEQSKAQIDEYLARLNAESTENFGLGSWSIKWIKFDNLFGYGENNLIDFTNLDGLVGVLGPNRIGKSSIIGAIMYVLFNTTDRGPVSGIHFINDHKKECAASICFELNGEEYVIERATHRVYKNDKETTKTSSSVRFYKKLPDGSEFSLNGVSVQDTDKEIRKVIGTPENFLLTSVSTQGDLFRFISEGAANRRRQLFRILELDIFEKIHTYAKEDAKKIKTTMEGKTLSESEWEKQIQNLNKSISTLKKQIQTCLNKKESIKIKRNKLNEWIKNHESNAAHASFVSYKEVIEEIEQLSSSIETKNEQIRKSKETIKDLRKAISELSAYVNKQDRDKLVSKTQVLKSFQSTMKELSHSLQTEKAKMEQQEKSIHKLALVPCGDQFPDCRFIKDSHQDKGRYETQKEIVEKLSKEYQELRESIDQLLSEKYEELLATLDQKSADLNNKTHLLAQVEERKSRIEAELINEKQKLQAAKDKEKMLKVQLDSKTEEEYQNKKKELQELESLNDELNYQIGNANQQIGSKQFSLKTIEEDRKRSEDATNKLTIINSIKDAFDKKAVPNILLQTQLPIINAEINKILSSYSDIKVHLEADVDSMDIYLEDNKNPRRRIIEVCSGMEKTMCAFVLRVAMNNISLISKSDIFILDEGFGALDSDSQQVALNMLSMFKDYFKSVLIISHEDPIKEAMEKIIEIEPGNEGSRVWVS